MLRFNHIPIHVHGVDNLELVLDTEVGDLSSEGRLIVTETTLFALERRHNNFFEKGNLCEQEACSTILLAVHAK